MTDLDLPLAQAVADSSEGTGLWFYLFAGVIAAAIFTSGVLALRWSMRKGDFPSEIEKFEKNALTIFSDEEPVGKQTDFFPDSKVSSQQGKSQEERMK